MKASPKRVIVKVDLNSKSSHQFLDGTTISLERDFNNFNRRYVSPVNATVINAPNIPEGAEMLIHHNATHDTNKVLNHSQLNGNEQSGSTFVYSIPDYDCFAWREQGSEAWKPFGIFDFALRVYKPYDGLMGGIKPTIIKDVLYVTTGDYLGMVVRTLKACDYEIIFQNNGKEERLIRFRSKGEEGRDAEVIAIDHELTEKVESGECLIGLSETDAKELEINAYAD